MYYVAACPESRNRGLAGRSSAPSTSHSDEPNIKSRVGHWLFATEGRGILRSRGGVNTRSQLASRNRVLGRSVTDRCGEGDGGRWSSCDRFPLCHVVGTERRHARLDDLLVQHEQGFPCSLCLSRQGYSTSATPLRTRTLNWILLIPHLFCRSYDYYYFRDTFLLSLSRSRCSWGPLQVEN